MPTNAQKPGTFQRRFARYRGRRPKSEPKRPAPPTTGDPKLARSLTVNVHGDLETKWNAWTEQTNKTLDDVVLTMQKREREGCESPAFGASEYCTIRPQESIASSSIYSQEELLVAITKEETKVVEVSKKRRLSNNDPSPTDSTKRRRLFKLLFRKRKDSSHEEGERPTVAEDPIRRGSIVGFMRHIRGSSPKPGPDDTQNPDFLEEDHDEVMQDVLQHHETVMQDYSQQYLDLLEDRQPSEAEEHQYQSSSLGHNLLPSSLPHLLPAEHLGRNQRPEGTDGGLAFSSGRGWLDLPAEDSE